MEESNLPYTEFTTLLNRLKGRQGEPSDNLHKKIETIKKRISKK